MRGGDGRVKQGQEGKGRGDKRSNTDKSKVKQEKKVCNQAEEEAEVTRGQTGKKTRTHENK